MRGEDLLNKIDDLRKRQKEYFTEPEETLYDRALKHGREVLEEFDSYFEPEVRDELAVVKDELTVALAKLIGKLFYAPTSVVVHHLVKDKDGG